MYIDTHAHLSDSKFDLDRDLVIKRAKENNITKIIEVSCEPYSWEKSFKISEINPDIYCAFGIHPHEAKMINPDFIYTLEKLLLGQKAIALGETGLDYYYNHSPKETQISAFKIHIELAIKLSKPLIIHCRDAYDDLISILEDYKGLKGVVHCFSGSLLQAQKVIDKGFLIGIDGPVTYPSAKILQNVVKEVSIDKMLLETDCPYLTPQEHRGKRNEPSYLPYIAQAISKIKGIPIEQVRDCTSQNAANLFNIK